MIYFHKQYSFDLEVSTDIGHDFPELVAKTLAEALLFSQESKLP